MNFSQYSQRQNDEYDVKSNFGKVRKYAQSREPSITTPQLYDEAQPNPQLFNDVPDKYGHTLAEPIGNYFRLEDKITKLTEKNDEAHEKMRSKMDDFFKDINKEFSKYLKISTTRWFLGIIISILVVVLGYLFIQITSTNEKIIRIESTFDENIKPSLRHVSSMDVSNVHASSNIGNIGNKHGSDNKQ
jgi:hypothetical protein